MSELISIEKETTFKLKRKITYNSELINTFNFKSVNNSTKIKLKELLRSKLSNNIYSILDNYRDKKFVNRLYL